MKGSTNAPFREIVFGNAAKKLIRVFIVGQHLMQLLFRSAEVVSRKLTDRVVHLTTVDILRQQQKIVLGKLNDHRGQTRRILVNWVFLFAET